MDINFKKPEYIRVRRIAGAGNMGLFYKSSPTIRHLSKCRICNAGSPTPAHGADRNETACHSDKELPGVTG
jgi:hypothetical protein